jgi:hypothetical protein
MSTHYRLSDHYETLGMILDELRSNPDVLLSTSAKRSLDLAITHYTEIKVSVDSILSESVSLSRELLQYQDRDRQIAGDYFRRIIGRYEAIFNAGGDGKLIYKVAKADGIDELYRLKILRTIFKLSLQEAQSLAADADRT